MSAPAGSQIMPPPATQPPLTPAGHAGLFALWVLVGLAGALTLLGMFSIGMFVLPVAAALLACAVWLTLRGADRWPAMAGLGVAAAAALAWLGVVLAQADPASGSCSGSPGGPVVCTDGAGQPWDPGSFAWAVGLPWFIAAALVLAGTLAGYLVARRVVTGRLRRQGRVLVAPPGR